MERVNPKKVIVRSQAIYNIKMEEMLKMSGQPLSKTVLNRQKIAKRIADLVVGRQQGRKVQITKRHVDRYLYTFAMEIGCELPGDETLKNIYFLLMDNEDSTHLKNGVQEAHFHILVNVCLNIYQEAKKTAIGGIFERIVMGLKQALYYIRLESLCPQGKAS